MSAKSRFFVDAKPLTRLDSLRELLDRLESYIGRMEKIGLGAQTIEIPELMDQAQEALDELGRSGIPVPEETARFITIGAQLKERAGVFLHSIGGAPALRYARQTKNPDPQRWWWFLDQWLAERKRSRAMRIILRAGVAIVVLALLYVMYESFLAPSPEEEARYGYEGTAERYLMEGNLESALGEVENALAIFPEDAELLLLKGVILHSMGREAEAGPVFAQAEANLGDRKKFLLMRGQDFISAGDFESGIKDAQAVIQIDPNSPEAYLLLGQGNELMENYLEAVNAYEKASELANAQNRPELMALARVRLAYLMQKIP